MTQPTPELLEELRLAADLRAAGVSWEAIASALKRNPDTCRQWPRTHAEAWRRLSRLAELEAARGAWAEARAVLRQLLRSNEDKSRLSAAAQLLKPRRVKPRRIEPHPISTEHRELAEFISEVKGLDDDKLQQMLADELSARRFDD